MISVNSSLFLYGFCICFVEMHLTAVGGCQCFGVGVLDTVFYVVGVLEGPNGIIFCVVYLFYKCFVQIDVRVCGGLPEFENCVFYNMLLMISVNVTVH